MSRKGKANSASGREIVGGRWKTFLGSRELPMDRAVVNVASKTRANVKLMMVHGERIWWKEELKRILEMASRSTVGVVSRSMSPHVVMQMLPTFVIFGLVSLFRF